MATKSKGSSSEKKLRSTIKKLEAKLESANAETARWKKESKRQRAAASASQASVTRLEKRLTKAKRSAGKSGPRHVAQPLPSTTEVTHEETPVSADGLTPAPDAGWTVVRLRAEARSRGLTGVSRKSKADLIDALTVPGATW